MTSPVTALHQLAQSAQMVEVHQAIERHTSHILQTAIAIQQIPAPTFDEEARAHYIQRQFDTLGLHDISVDDVFNVYGRWPGQQPEQPALLVSAHLDTVFPADTKLAIRYEQERVYGPGLGDNSLGIAGMLALIEIMQQHDIRPVSDIWFVANSREEGLGDLGGIRAVWRQLQNQIAAAIVIEGMALGRIYHAGIAVRRLRITCRAEGGHSWLHFGRKTAVHGLIELGARILAEKPPAKPRTTYNIGTISGGHSVNSLATNAELYLDMRSESAATLRELEESVRAAIRDLTGPELTFDIDVVGDRPAGCISTDHPLVQAATAALQAIDHHVHYENGSTDANALLANGLPTVTVGIAYGGHAHREDEFIETGPIANGIWHLLLLVMTAANEITPA